jgi:3-keto-5-aminohexanoate cleavage enzyme
VMQFGVAAARLEERKKIMALRPDMMSVIFGPHDECFQPDWSIPANEIYASHPRSELLDYARTLDGFGIRPEIECFSPGAYWNVDYIRRRVSLPVPLFCTIFLGWPGGTWLPPTPKSLSYMLDYLPENCIWNLSVQDSEAHWGLMTQAIMLGGHVRVGWEDNPYIAPGVFAERNSELVRKVRELARSLGRPIASPEEARQILGLTVAQTVA